MYPLNLGNLPVIDIEILDTESDTKGSFLKVDTYNLKAKYEDQTESNQFKFDLIRRRKSQDASAIIPYFTDSDGRINVYLRSCLRPAVGLKSIKDGSSISKTANIWEIAAGVIEFGETPLATAKRELREEIGFEQDNLSFRQLGLPFYTSPGLSGEELYIFAVEVDPLKRLEPSLDGGEMEKRGVVETMYMECLSDAFKYNVIKDAKSEIGLRRLEDMFAGK
jgi:8-oxo-dGTP pyrophosphatase MutT (NUDIX family)